MSDLIEVSYLKDASWNTSAFTSYIWHRVYDIIHSTKKPVTTMLTYPWKCTVLHCNHLENTWKPRVLMTRHFDYCPSASEGDNQSVRSSAPVVSRCFPGGYNVKLYISRGRLAWWLLAFLHSDLCKKKHRNCKTHMPFRSTKPLLLSLFGRWVRDEREDQMPDIKCSDNSTHLLLLAVHVLCFHPITVVHT